MFSTADSHYLVKMQLPIKKIAFIMHITSSGVYNPQNEMFRLLGTKRSFSQNETFFFSHP